jgi:hypothetical protein
LSTGESNFDEKNVKEMGDVLELPAKQHFQFSPFGPFSWWIG